MTEEALLKGVTADHNSSYTGKEVIASLTFFLAGNLWIRL